MNILNLKKIGKDRNLCNRIYNLYYFSLDSEKECLHIIEQRYLDVLVYPKRESESYLLICGDGTLETSNARNIEMPEIIKTIIPIDYYI